MNYRKISFKDHGSFVVTDDPDDIIHTYIANAVYDMRQLDPSGFKDFIKRFDPMGKGYHVYDTATASRTTFASESDGPSWRAEDDWTIRIDSSRPSKTMRISGDELRDLFRQVITGLMPYFPELKYAYES